MSTEALVTMMFAWSIVAFFAGKFFLKVLKNPTMKGTDE